MFIKGFWIPPMICGMLFAGCAARTAWAPHAYAAGANNNQADGTEGRYQEKEAQTYKNHYSQKKEPAPDPTQGSCANDKSQMDKVAEIMRASTESTIQALSAIFKK